VLSFRVREVRPIAALLLMIAPRTLGLFLLGACVWRWGILRTRPRRIIGAIAALGIPFGAYATWLLSTNGAGRYTGEISIYAPIVLAFGYAAVIVALLPIFSKLAPLGRMALTNYLSQSIILGFVFYGYGLGKFEHMGAMDGLLLAIGLYAAQAIASTFWLRRYRFGPVEWLWRAVTYGKRPPMRISGGAPSPTR
jgi:uncharacterized protein